MPSRMTLLAAGLCLAATPALAGDLSPADETGPMLLSETEMDSVVGGIVIQRFLRTGAIIGEDSNGNPIYKQIVMPEQGAQKMFDGEGPNNNGVLSLQDFDVTPPSFPPGLTLTLDGTLVGTQSNGRGARFITINLNLP